MADTQVTPGAAVNNYSNTAESSTFRRRASKLGLFSLLTRSKATFDLESPKEQLETEIPSPRPRDDASFQDVQPVPSPVESEPRSRERAVLRRPLSMGTLKSKSTFRREGKRVSTWTPPPLFQVYPQAVKHTTIRVPTQSPEVILRQKRDNKSGRFVDHDQDGIEEKNDLKGGVLKKIATEFKYQGGWVDKIFVMVTAGYLLQYAGTGSFDRGPEKILPLNACTAAYASDAIPGKHFVLQISQVSSQDGTLDLDMSKWMLKKLGLRSEAKRAASVFLLPLETAYDMDEWLIAVRKEIEAVGGRIYKPDVLTESEFYTEPGVDIERASSPRQPVRRTPQPCIEQPTEPVSDMDLCDLIVSEMPDFNPMMAGPAPIPASEPAIELEPEFELHPPDQESTATRESHESRESRYVSGTDSSIDQVHLDRLRGSYASASGVTNSTSRDSSPSRRPSNGGFDFAPTTMVTVPKTSLSMGEASPGLVQDFSYIYNGNRESMQPTPTPESRRVSVVPASPVLRTTSPPNFSVPTFSKRFSTASGSPAPSTTAQSPSLAACRLSPAPLEDGSTPREAEHPRPTSTIGELVPQSSSRQSSYSQGTNKRYSTPQQQPPSPFYTPPTTSHSFTVSENKPDQNFSRRFSSLDYAKGISPVQLSGGHSAPPHPPPTCPLPPLPTMRSNSSKRISLIPPPTGLTAGSSSSVPTSIESAKSSVLATPPLPTPPSSGQQSSDASEFNLPLQTPSPGEPAIFTAPPPPPPASSNEGPSRPTAKRLSKMKPIPLPRTSPEKTRARGLRPAGVSAHPTTAAADAAESPNKKTFTLDHQIAAAAAVATPSPSPDSSSSSPPRPTRQAPLPPPPPFTASTSPIARPPTPPKLTRRKSQSRIGRTPPPVPPPSVDTRVAVATNKSMPTSPSSTPASPGLGMAMGKGTSGVTVPPQIDFSTGPSRSPLDGPWNSGYLDHVNLKGETGTGSGQNASSRTFLDLTIG